MKNEMRKKTFYCLLILLTNLTKKVPDATNIKQSCQSYLKRENYKTGKNIESNYSTTTKNFENQKIVGMKSVTTADEKTSPELSKTRGQVGKVSELGFWKGFDST